MQKQVVVWDIDENPLAIINPEVVESDGEWVYDEGCLSIPGLYVEMLRPKTVLVRGVDLNGEIIEIEADELEARMFQHEIDHLNGVLMFDRLEGDQRKEAIKEYRRIEEEAAQAGRRRDSHPAAPRSGMRIVYLGTPEMAVAPLRALVEAGHEIVLGRHTGRQAARTGERRVAEPGEGRGDRTRPPGVARRRRRGDGRVATTERSSAWSWRSGRSSSPTCSTRSRWSTSTSRCCHAGVVRHRSSGRCWRATT